MPEIDHSPGAPWSHLKSKKETDLFPRGLGASRLEAHREECAAGAGAFGIGLDPGPLGELADRHAEQRECVASVDVPEKEEEFFGGDQNNPAAGLLPICVND